MITLNPSNNWDVFFGWLAEGTKDLVAVRFRCALIPPNTSNVRLIPSELIRSLRQVSFRRNISSVADNVSRIFPDLSISSVNTKLLSKLMRLVLFLEMILDECKIAILVSVNIYIFNIYKHPFHKWVQC